MIGVVGGMGLLGGVAGGEVAVVGGEEEVVVGWRGRWCAVAMTRGSRGGRNRVGMVSVEVTASVLLGRVQVIERDGSMFRLRWSLVDGRVVSRRNI